MISITYKGDFSKTLNFLKRPRKIDISLLNQMGQEGVQALSEATPVRTGKTASSWYYEIVQEGDKATIRWCNSNTERTISIAALIQYGHATVSGGWVEGIDYINPAMQKVYDKFEGKIRKEVFG